MPSALRSLPLYQTQLLPLISELESKLDLAPQTLPPRGSITLPCARSAAIFPRIPVILRKRTYQCVGHFRLYDCRKYMLDEADEIPVMVLSKHCKRAELFEAYLIERLLLSRLYQLSK